MYAYGKYIKQYGKMLFWQVLLINHRHQKNEFFYFNQIYNGEIECRICFTINKTCKISIFQILICLPFSRIFIQIQIPEVCINLTEQLKIYPTLHCIISYDKACILYNNWRSVPRLDADKKPKYQPKTPSQTWWLWWVFAENRNTVTFVKLVKRFVHIGE